MNFGELWRAMRKGKDMGKIMKRASRDRIQLGEINWNGQQKFITIKSLLIFSKFLRQDPNLAQTLTNIFLSNLNLDERLGPVLETFVEYCPNLRILGLGGNPQLRDTVLKTIPLFGRLRKIYLWECGITDIVAIEIATALPNTTTLNEMSLFENTFDTEYILSFFINAIKRNISFTRFPEMTDKGKYHDRIAVLFNEEGWDDRRQKYNINSGMYTKSHHKQR